MFIGQFFPLVKGNLYFMSEMTRDVLCPHTHIIKPAEYLTQPNHSRGLQLSSHRDDLDIVSLIYTARTLNFELVVLIIIKT